MYERAQSAFRTGLIPAKTRVNAQKIGFPLSAGLVFQAEPTLYVII
jgi:hypothetical protein